MYQILPGISLLSFLIFHDVSVSAQTTAAVTDASAGGQLFALDSADVSSIVDGHNSLRRSITDAANMRQLSWDSGLADLAAGWASTCDANHRPSGQRIGVKGFEYVGENMYWGSQSAKPNMATVLRDWWAQQSFYTYSAYPNGCQTGKLCGQFTQMAWADTCAVGCAVARCGSIKNGLGISSGYVLVCNYGPSGNFFGENPWAQGKPCSSCTNASCSNELCGSGCAKSTGTTPSFTTTTFATSTAGGNTTFASATTGSAKTTAAASSTPGQPTTAKATTAVTASPSPSPSPSSSTSAAPVDKCRNTHQLCAYWARLGECESNKDWMLSHCAGSCNRCSDIQFDSESCEDKDTQCQSWRSRGQCRTNFDFMRWRCRSSCGLCNSSSIDALLSRANNNNGFARFTILDAA